MTKTKLYFNYNNQENIINNNDKKSVDCSLVRLVFGLLMRCWW